MLVYRELCAALKTEVSIDTYEKEGNTISDSGITFKRISSHEEVRRFFFSQIKKYSLEFDFYLRASSNWKQEKVWGEPVKSLT